MLRFIWSDWELEPKIDMGMAQVYLRDQPIVGNEHEVGGLLVEGVGCQCRGPPAVEMN